MDDSIIIKPGNELNEIFSYLIVYYCNILSPKRSTHFLFGKQNNQTIGQHLRKDETNDE